MDKRIDDIGFALVIVLAAAYIVAALIRSTF
jgi:hypothetical protein